MLDVCTFYLNLSTLHVFYFKRRGASLGSTTLNVFKAVFTIFA